MGFSCLLLILPWFSQICFKKKAFKSYFKFFFNYKSDKLEHYEAVRNNRQGLHTS